MGSLKEIRNRIKSIKSTQQTTRAMKMVAASKLRKAQDRMLNFRPYSNKLNGILNRLMAAEGDAADLDNAYLANRATINNVCYVVITSDRGLCGAFNMAIIRRAEQHMRDTYPELYQKSALKILCVGRKGREYFAKRGFEILGQDLDVLSNISIDAANQVSELAMNGFLNEEFDRVYLCYNAFKNVATHIRTVEPFLPLSLEATAAATATSSGEEQADDYIYEMDRSSIVENLVPQILKANMYRAILESNASEQGARMIAMDNATENAQELIEELQLKYNKARQAAITKEILEIVSGANALEQ
jgi:F-type H+-transporting ATPase subunit gamma